MRDTEQHVMCAGIRIGINISERASSDDDDRMTRMGLSVDNGSFIRILYKFCQPFLLLFDILRR